MAQKFVVTLEGRLRLGDVRLHKNLLLPGDTCIGGGFWEVDRVGCRLLLDRESFDYGPPRWNYLVLEGRTLRVPAEYRGLQIVYSPDDWGSEPFVVSERLPIAYD